LQSLQADVSGTSINSTYNSSTGILSLKNFDNIKNYRSVLASVRYRNAGQLAPSLVFTRGVRTIVVNVSDSAGGFAVANASVTCEPEQRIYVVGRDPASLAPADCNNGNGTLVIAQLTVRGRSLSRHALCRRTLTVVCTG